MGNINWESVWNKSLSDKELFPFVKVKDNTISLACPTRFSNNGELAIQIAASFNKESIVLELLVFNENLLLEDLPEYKDLKKIEFNTIATQLAKYELSNRIMERFKIKSAGFESDTEAVNALVDYMNNKATESGRMFDDKLDELNDTIEANKVSKHEKLINSIKEGRAVILNKVCSILKEYYSWKPAKNEGFDDSSLPLYDKNGSFVAVVSFVDGHIIIDLGNNITSKISVVQSDEEIEEEIVADVDNATAILADQEIEELKEIVADNHVGDNMKDSYPVAKVPGDVFSSSESYVDRLAKRVTKLENLYIRRKLRTMK